MKCDKCEEPLYSVNGRGSICLSCPSDEFHCYAVGDRLRILPTPVNKSLGRDGVEFVVTLVQGNYVMGKDDNGEIAISTMRSSELV